MQYHTNPLKQVKTPEEIAERISEIDSQLLLRISEYMGKKIAYDQATNKSREGDAYIQKKIAREIMRDLHIERSILMWVLGA